MNEFQRLWVERRNVDVVNMTSNEVKCENMSIVEQSKTVAIGSTIVRFRNLIEQLADGHIVRLGDQMYYVQNIGVGRIQDYQHDIDGINWQATVEVSYCQIINQRDGMEFVRELSSFRV